MTKSTNQLKFLFRADKTNVGDWVCPPFHYFPFRPNLIGDIININFELNSEDILILGGGGIGSKFFSAHLDRIKKKYLSKTILWGAGVDSFVDKTKILINEKYDLYGNYFDFICDVGTRVYSEPQKFRYVPCASCMNNLFFKYRDKKPKHFIGFYNHKRVPLLTKDNNDKIPVEDNNGNNFEEKLEFLSSCEYIVTNTYHGAYWATLLQKKVIVIPYKSGLMSLQHKPVYCWDNNISDQILHSAKVYEGVLEEHRKLNLDFYKYLTDKYHLV